MDAYIKSALWTSGVIQHVFWCCVPNDEWVTKKHSPPESGVTNQNCAVMV